MDETTQDNTCEGYFRRWVSRQKEVGIVFNPKEEQIAWSAWRNSWTSASGKILAAAKEASV